MKDIAVYCESFRSWPAHVAYAASMAKAFDASLTGTCVCPSPQMGLPTYDAPGLAVQLIDEARHLMDDAHAAEPAFVAFAQQQGVRQAQWQAAQGYVLDCLAIVGTWHDLLVLGRAGNTPWGSSFAVGNVVLGSGTPCLIVPEKHDGTFAPRCVAIAWNGSIEALRAVHAALPILARAERVLVFSRDAQQPFVMENWLPQFDLFSYLQRHGIAAQPGHMDDSTKGVGHDLLRAAADAHADLLVMGAYGHARFREWILGGVTKDVLEQATIPVMMRH